ncbi:MAG: hypothetical protein BEN19_07620 [Epulopiscium sp. Nuni2H_MBin003]|nr:MAG: hypothetical protein BEN19_07620 [Epulopiscium sp. Nuni2H_MBin003]
MQTYRKILLATMSFDIGGVETHVLELATGLKKCGLVPIVVSNGGVYVKELNKRGITHITVPLNDKNPKHMLDSYLLLRKIIRREKVDIVHAHARIPAFILGILQKKEYFPLVTSVHALFNTMALYKLNSNWGDYSIAVSDDLKKYLVKYYKINPRNIMVTVNGISPDTFNKNVKTKDIITKYKIDKTKIVIGHISRLDKERSLVAEQLVNIAKSLYKVKPNTQIVIVGDGTEYSKIKNKADKINQALGKKYIVMVGSSIEVNKFVAVSDIFVGVSRAALEAMCAKRPTIVAGNEGYIGIFDKSKLSSAKKSNFTCRGERNSDEDVLKDDIVTLIESTEQELVELGEYSHEIVKKYYSVEKMTQDNIKLYDRVWRKKLEL